MGYCSRSLPCLLIFSSVIFLIKSAEYMSNLTQYYVNCMVRYFFFEMKPVWRIRVDLGFFRIQVLSLFKYLRFTVQSVFFSTKQCCGSGSLLDPYSGASWIRIRIQNMDPYSEYGSGSTHVKIVKNEGKRNKIYNINSQFKDLPE